MQVTCRMRRRATMVESLSLIHGQNRILRSGVLMVEGSVTHACLYSILQTIIGTLGRLSPFTLDLPLNKTEQKM
jgi:hypothetical protein